MTTDNNKLITSITLKTNDNKLFQVEEAVAMEMGSVKIFFKENDDSSPSNTFTINVSSGLLTHIIGYITKYLELRDKAEADKNTEIYNAEFLKEMKNDELHNMVLAAHYLDIKYLYDLLVQAVADHIKNKSVEYVRRYFAIENSEFSGEEEEMLRKEYAWAFEDVDED